MKKLLTLLLLAAMLTAPLAGCSDTSDAPAKTTDGKGNGAIIVTDPLPECGSSGDTPAETTEGKDNGTIIVTDPLPGNPDKYKFVMRTPSDPEKWFYFEEDHHWSYMYTSQTNIGETLDLSLLKLSAYDEETDSYHPSPDSCEKGWSQKNDGISSSLTPITGTSAVLAFTAPKDGCYLFEFAFNAGMQAGTNSDGVNFLLFGDNKLVYSFRSTQIEIEGEIEEKFISLRKGEKAYFVADPLSSGTGDICESVHLQVIRQADLYIDNENSFGFGYVYENFGLTQGMNGWYAGYADKDWPITPYMVGSNPIAEHIIKFGNLFGMIAGDDAYDSEKEAVVIWEAPDNGNFTISVAGWMRGSISISFYNGETLITSIENQAPSVVYEMTCNLKKGECFAVVFLHSASLNEDAIEQLQILVQCDS